MAIDVYGAWVEMGRWLYLVISSGQYWPIFVPDQTCKSRPAIDSTHPSGSLVLKLESGFYSLETANTFVRFVDCETDNEAEEQVSVVRLSRQEGPGEN
ncbi:hypothetical protein KY284_010556 [Solanum tuberosum]|nr:hypothetical protein KY284_010556 [Solanum tuberosum]